jgi:ribosomal protein S18 acetylase RimI-like enzyme
MNTLTIDIRDARLQDAPTIADVHNEAWSGAYSGIIPHKALTRMLARRNREWWSNAIRRNASILVIEAAGRVVGYATIGRNRTSQIDAEGEIYELYIAPQYQGIGLGTRLFSEARRVLENHAMRGVVVWALEENVNACDFYYGKGGRDIAEGTEKFDERMVKKIAFVWH